MVETRERIARYVFMPDFFNNDIGDVTGAPGYNPSMPNSINQKWLDAIDVVLGEVKKENADAHLVAGDLVEGHWHVDSDGTKVFGPVGTAEQVGQAIINASEVYYPWWKNLFSSRNMPVYVAIGDHEIGDDQIGGAEDVNDRWPVSGVRYKNIEVFKEQFGKHFVKPYYPDRPTGVLANNTAYATVLPGNTLLVSVDMFQKNADGVRIGVFNEQLDWLRSVLREVRNNFPRRKVIVQGHVPVLMPVRSVSSGRLRVPEGEESGFWKVLEEFGVDLYLCGEVHDVTAKIGTKVVQIAHGGLFRQGFKYCVIDRFNDGSWELTSKAVKMLDTGTTASVLWCCDENKRPNAGIEYAAERVVNGRMKIDNSEILSRSGDLGVYSP